MQGKFFGKKLVKNYFGAQKKKKRGINQQANEMNMHDVNQFGFSTHDDRKLGKDYYKFCYVDI